MRLYFAPLEGITGYIYRNTHSELFGGCDAYYAPFITPVENERLNKKCMRDILPENNACARLCVQLLSNTYPTYLKFEEEILAMGYESININFGCPSGTVVKKGRGAGFLRDIKEVDRFLYDVFSANKVPVSVKTRIGFYSEDEADELIGVYNEHPLSSLIIHPRTREDYYKGEVREDVFCKMYTKSKNPVCYNGDVRTKEDFLHIKNTYDNLEGVMIGRGAVANPAIFREINGGAPLETEEIINFSHILAQRYYAVLGSDMYTLHKLKEIWLYMISRYPDEKKIHKAIKKSSTVSELHSAVECLPKR